MGEMRPLLALLVIALLIPTTAFADEMTVQNNATESTSSTSQQVQAPNNTEAHADVTVQNNVSQPAPTTQPTAAPHPTAIPAAVQTVTAPPPVITAPPVIETPALTIEPSVTIVATPSAVIQNTEPKNILEAIGDFVSSALSSLSQSLTSLF